MAPGEAPAGEAAGESALQLLGTAAAPVLEAGLLAAVGMLLARKVGASLAA